MMINRRILIVAIVITVFFAGCTSNNGNSDIDLSSCSYETMTERILEQIDRELDDYLNDEPDRSLYEMVRLQAITYGSFTASEREECMAVFKFRDAPHAAGFDRTLVAVCEANDLQIISQHSFAADQVMLFLLPSNDQRQRILFIGSSTFQGFTANHIQLMQVEAGEWVSMEVFAENPGADVMYSYSDGLLHIFNQTYEKGYLEYQYKDSFYWDNTEKIFFNSDE